MRHTTSSKLHHMAALIYSRSCIEKIARKSEDGTSIIPPNSFTTVAVSLIFLLAIGQHKHWIVLYSWCNCTGYCYPCLHQFAILLLQLCDGHRICNHLQSYILQSICNLHQYSMLRFIQYTTPIFKLHIAKNNYIVIAAIVILMLSLPNPKRWSPKRCNSDGPRSDAIGLVRSEKGRDIRHYWEGSDNDTKEIDETFEWINFSATKQWIYLQIC